MVKKTSISFLSSKKIPSDLMKLNVTDTDYIHVDVMDGKFVKEKTLRFKDMKNIYKYTSKRLDVHLMVKDVKKEIKPQSDLEVSLRHTGRIMYRFGIRPPRNLR